MDLLNEEIESLNLYDSIIKNFKKIGINTIYDCLEFLPNKYIDNTPVDINGFYNESVMIYGKICTNAITRHFKKNLSSMNFSIIVQDEIIKATIFNRNFYKDKIVVGEYIYLHGKYDYLKKTIVCDNLFFKVDDTITPVYPLSFSSKSMKFSISNILSKYKNNIIEILPNEIINKYKFLPISDMYKFLHMPKSKLEYEIAIERYKYQELFLFMLKLEILKNSIKKEYKEPKKYDIGKVREFINTIPFELTDDQKNVCNDIFRDFKQNYPANRLIEGDVGSGKTIVSAIAIYGAITAGYQAALMAPTEILANQHYINLCKLFNNEINIELMTSSVKGKKRNIILDKVKNGEVDLLIGTHSIIQDEVSYKNLGLVITDEQHRFGVKQREALKNKGSNPDVLFLSATPIPRTLAMSLFADLDISKIVSKPSNRKEIETKLINYDNLDYLKELVDKEVSNNHQIYFIAPLINESESLDFKNVFELYDEAKEMFSNYNIGLLHGQMKENEKKEVMEDFKNHKYDILVSTTVIEVGIDVANATLIAIFDANRFGLSQLHQLRGRVGRSELESKCILISNSDTERLRIVEGVYDGFTLADEDLRLRGPGDFFGVKQSGVPSFKFADLKNDLNIIRESRNDAIKIAENIDNYENLKYFVFQNNLKE